MSCGDLPAIPVPGTQRWPVPTDFPPLAADTLHVWRIPLTAPTDRLIDYESVLTVEELGRVRRFIARRHQLRFLIGRARLRYLLGKYLGVPAAQVPIRYANLGKPFVELPVEGQPLQFNFSNSHELALLAVGRGAFQLGVDLERVASDRDLEGLAHRFYHAHETADLARSSDGQEAAFYRCWTRKEAFLKAVGKGLTFPLCDVVVTCRPQDPPRILRIGSQPAHLLNWRLHHLDPGRAYVGAIVQDGGIDHVRLWQWTDWVARG